MFYENEYVRPSMSEYYFQPQAMQSTMFYPEMYETMYYQPPFQPNRNYVQPPPYAYYLNSSPTNDVNTNRVMQQFLDEDGQVDIQKMLKTVGQLADTVQQVSPVIKQLNDLIKNFRA